MKFIVMSVLAALSALGFYFYSGAAEGLASERTIFALIIAPIYLFAFLYSLRLLYLRFLKKIILPPGEAKLLLISAVLLCFSYLVMDLGNRVDRRLISESQVEGDRLLKYAQEYYSINGRYPKSNDELKSAGVALPQSKLLHSTLSLTLGPKGEPEVSFNSTNFTVCEKSLGGSWVCDD